LRLLDVPHDQKRQVDDHIGTGDERVHRGAVEHVALAVLGLAQALGGRIERSAGHGDDRSDFPAALQRAQERSADVAGWSRDGDGEFAAGCAG